MDFLREQKRNNLNVVLTALQVLCARHSNQTTPPPQEQWPRTRDIAEYCEISIYIARYHLIKLVENKQAYVTSKSASNSLHWYIASASAPTPKKITQHHSIERT